MTTDQITAAETLVQAFGALSDAQMARLKRHAGWIRAGLHQPGWTCCVEQGHYGHRARKASWLYAHACEMPVLKWGAAPSTARLDEGFHSAAERRRAIKDGRLPAAVRPSACSHAVALPRSPPLDRAHGSRGSAGGVMARKSKPTGSTWRVLAHERDGCGPGQLRANQDGATADGGPFQFDELVVDKWLHLEQRSARVWWMRVGEIHFHIGIDRNGKAYVTITEGAEHVNG